jgi:hypothetical protein
VSDISVIIPVYNRGELVRYTLESVRRASDGLSVETIIVDDGSEPPAMDSIARLGFSPHLSVRQENRGLLHARLSGLERATGRYVLFLDSDDLVGPDKLRLQLAAMDAAGADVSYTDSARCLLEGGFDALAITADPPCLSTRDPAEFFITVQPPPHSPVFRTDYLRRIVAGAFFPPSPLYGCVAEIWFYHNAAPRPARIAKVPGAHTIVGAHPGTRLTNHWEQLGVASLAVMEAFARTCPETADAARARQRVAEKAFASWRRLPRGFSSEFCSRELAVWQQLDRGGDPGKIGGPGFRALARLFGPLRAGRLLALVQNGRYADCRTLDDAALQQLLGALPPPGRPIATPV